MGFFIVDNELQVVEVLRAEAGGIEVGFCELAQCVFVEDVLEVLQLYWELISESRLGKPAED